MGSSSWWLMVASVTVSIICSIETTSNNEVANLDINNQTYSYQEYFCDDLYDGIYTDTAYCNRYYKCLRQDTYLKECNDGLLYDIRKKSCEKHGNVQCHRRLIPGSIITHAPPFTTTKTPKTTKTLKTTETLMTTGILVTTEILMTTETLRTTETLKTTEKPKTTQTPKTDPTCPRIVCYFPHVSQYRPGRGQYGADDIDPRHCTHIIYSFPRIEGGASHGRDDHSIPSTKRKYEKLIELKKTYPNLKILLSIGRWDVGSIRFSKMIATKAYRHIFIESTVSTLRRDGFDGLDLDWEFKAWKKAPSRVKNNFILLCQELRTKFDAGGKGVSKLLLTASVKGVDAKKDVAYDVMHFHATLDFINLKTFDFHGGWEEVTAHHSPLYNGSWESGLVASYNVKSTVETWLDLGLEKDKLVVGLPLYARTFKLISKFGYKVGAPVDGGGLKGPFTKEVGFLAYYEVCELMKLGDVVKKKFIREQRVPYLVAGNTWIGYDDEKSLREKVRFIKHLGLGGAMVWDISLDDFSGGFCNAGKNPLLRAVSDECYKK